MLSDALDALAARRRDWVEAVGAGDLDRYADIVAEDLVWIPPSGDPIEGRAAFRRWLSPFLVRYSYRFSVEPDQIRTAGRWCAELGRFRSVLTAKSSGEAREHAGRYFVLWRREDDDVWRIERYVDGIGSAGGPPEALVNADL